MATKAIRMKNFHVPLPEDLYNKLRFEANHSKLPATELARQAIELWVKKKRKVALHNAIVDYANKNAGSEFDLDQELEAASIEHLNTEE